MSAEVLRVGSLFSGIGGIDLGLERAGMTTAWQCEIDPDARKVLAHRWPTVTRYDDVKELTGDGVAAVDVLCGGFPCQDLSVAGRRAGLAGERSGLFHEFMRVAAELAPRWVLIENVPGLLSSNDGRDMGVVLGVLADLGYGFAWRVLDAQYFGVAQRRRRVFIVGCLGSPAGAASVLLEPESCSGNPAPSREAGEGVAGTLGGGSGSRGWAPDTDRMTFVPEEVADTLRSHPRPGSNSLGALAFIWQAGGKNDASGALEHEMTPTLPKSQTIAVAYPLAMRGRADGAELEIGEEGVYNALRAGDGGSSRANWVAFSENQRGEVLETEYARPITTGGGKPGQGYPAVRQGMAVRRLTPLECERLQGFPDGWTDVPNITGYGGKKGSQGLPGGVSDSARYRMLGNAVCVPVAEWIGRNLTSAHKAEEVAA